MTGNGSNPSMCRCGFQASPANPVHGFNPGEMPETSDVKKDPAFLGGILRRQFNTELFKKLKDKVGTGAGCVV